jgi:glutathione S-transferase
MALGHKGLDFETRPVLFTEIKDIGNGFSPTVPVLDDRGMMLRDSFDIALYLEENYPDRPSLFKGDGGKAHARFVESWCISFMQPRLLRLIVKDIYDRLDSADQPYFRGSREKFFGQTLEALHEGRDEKVGDFRDGLGPLRTMFGRQPFLGGNGPLFADYIIFAHFQWARVMSPLEILCPDDVVAHWFQCCLDLHFGMGREMPSASAG